MYLQKNELEIAMITRNRSAFVSEWLENNFAELQKRNISLSIWDSSDNDDTKVVVEAYSGRHACTIRYERVAADTAVGHKVIWPLLGVDAEYVWPVADRRAFYWQEIDEKVLPLVRFGFASITLQLPQFHSCEKIFTDVDAYSCESLSAISCVGQVLFNTQIFKYIRNDAATRAAYEKKYAYARGFAFLGYVYEALARSTALNVITTIDSKQSKRASRCSWLNEYTQMIYNELPKLLDNLPEAYVHRHDLPRILIQQTQKDYRKWILQSIHAGGITADDIAWLAENHVLERLYQPEVVQDIKRMLALGPEQAEQALQEYDASYNELNRRYIEQVFSKHIQRHINGRKIAIWGMGVQSQHVIAFLADCDINIDTYIDAKAADMQAVGQRVIPPEDIGSLEEYYIILTTRNRYGEIWDTLHAKQYQDETDFYWIFEGLNAYMQEQDFQEW